MQNLIHRPYMESSKPPQMENLLIEPQNTTPFVKFKKDHGLLLIKGKSVDERATEFYAPVIKAVDHHLNKTDKLTCYFYFKEYNLPTAKALFQLFKIFTEHHVLGKVITINWFADWHNNEIIQTGIDFSELYKIKMNILPI